MDRLAATSRSTRSGPWRAPWSAACPDRLEREDAPAAHVAPRGRFVVVEPGEQELDQRVEVGAGARRRGQVIGRHASPRARCPRSRARTVAVLKTHRTAGDDAATWTTRR